MNKTVNPGSRSYEEGFSLSLVNNRLDNEFPQQQSSDRIWVDDPRVEGGGYWRRASKRRKMYYAAGATAAGLAGAAAIGANIGARRTEKKIRKEIESEKRKASHPAPARKRRVKQEEAQSEDQESRKRRAPKKPEPPVKVEVGEAVKETKTSDQNTE
ncbi:MAG TPA: hypothetical protein V6C65_00635, partial [Allocoleopsis sp.]